ncbi:MAG: iron-containing redox enzyme family protein, partial [Gammaproteobacteria bacterium]|nr:iron-containing redox enzyme family protein [Gammaproteobacteria bacterium]
SMGARVAAALAPAGERPQFIAAGTTGGDCAAPGLANLIQGELHWPPLETLSITGICAASVGALNAAAQAVESGGANEAIALASEFPSRLFKKSRFEGRNADVDFNAHFLRWMLSDGAGGVRIANKPADSGLSFRIKWIHQKSFSGDMPTCMQVGMSLDNPPKGYLDYPTLDAAEKAGAYDLRQDIRLLPNLFDLGMHEYAALARAGHVDPKQIDWFLCHYSSERFKPVVATLMEEAGLAIPQNKWFSNLSSRGNTGSASIFIMLDEFVQTMGDRLKPGNLIFGFVPESGRFSVAYFLLEVVAPNSEHIGSATEAYSESLPPAPVDAPSEPGPVADLLTELMSVWHNYRSEVFRTPLVRKILGGHFGTTDYIGWMENWIPQVREGSLWMRRAASSMTSRFAELSKLVQTHAGEEQLDWHILYDDYRRAGGTLSPRQLVRNPGGEALNAFMHAYAAQSDPVGLLGGIYIIEGTGQRIIPTLLPRLRDQLGLPLTALKFLDYHGENDQHHMRRWLDALHIVASTAPSELHKIVQVACTVADLYLSQWRYIDA